VGHGPKLAVPSETVGCNCEAYWIISGIVNENSSFGSISSRLNIAHNTKTSKQRVKRQSEVLRQIKTSNSQVRSWNAFSTFGISYGHVSWQNSCLCNSAYWQMEKRLIHEIPQEANRTIHPRHFFKILTMQVFCHVPSHTS